MSRLSKYIQSFLKKDWSLEDYPISEVPVDASAFEEAGKAPPRALMVERWIAMNGIGPTLEEAWDDLRGKFEEYRSSGKPLPRPGAYVQPEFTSAEGLEAHEELAQRFFPEVLGLNFDDCFVSDESSLSDFYDDTRTKEQVHAKLKDCFGLDASTIQDDRLVAVFDAISSKKSEDQPRE